mmetsp:Transcript_4537/g.10965  ORF Transcript_4537/g.10965 Transcript_4537/m.10965 type:complete len:93 (+) Transcript_4537:44-322(+)
MVTVGPLQGGLARSRRDQKMKHGSIRPSLLSLLALAAPLSCVFVGSYLPGGSRGLTVQRHAQALPPIPPLPPLTGAAGRGKKKRLARNATIA